MSFLKFVFVGSLVLFIALGAAAYVKKTSKKSAEISSENVEIRQEVEIESLRNNTPEAKESLKSLPTELSCEEPSVQQQVQPVVIEHEDGEEALSTLFEKSSSCPIVQTIPYKSKVHWKQYSKAWLIDYAHHFKTPLGFICKMISGSYDAKNPQINEGQLINVFRTDVNFHFHAVVCFSSCTLRLYYVLPDKQKVVFLKKYSICLGRKDPSKPSQCLTPLGVYELGARTCVYQPRVMGIHKGKKVEMISVFGTHWIPFEKEIARCTSPAKGYGIHGTPMIRNDQTGELQEDNRSLGQYESDGCIRLSGRDILEVFSLISTRKTYVEIVSSFQDSQLFSGSL